MTLLSMTQFLGLNISTMTLLEDFKLENGKTTEYSYFVIAFYRGVYFCFILLPLVHSPAWHILQTREKLLIHTLKYSVLVCGPHIMSLFTPIALYLLQTKPNKQIRTIDGWVKNPTEPYLR